MSKDLILGLTVLAALSGSTASFLFDRAKSDVPKEKTSWRNSAEFEAWRHKRRLHLRFWGFFVAAVALACAIAIVLGASLS